MDYEIKCDATMLIKLPKAMKEKAIDKAFSKRCNLSEYIRNLISKDLEKDIYGI